MPNQYGTIDTAMKLQYNQTLSLLTQQKQSALSAVVRRETIEGKRTAWDRIGPTEAQKRTGRHTDTPLIGTPYDRRWVDAATWDWADLIDKPDVRRILVDPTGPYVQNAVAAFNRVKDRVIIDAAFGTAYAGEEGLTAVPFPAANIIAPNAVAQGVAGDATGLTIDKLRIARKMFRQAYVEDDAMLYMVVSASQLDNMLSNTEVTSADYNSVKALVNGDVDTFMGFKFIHSELLPFNAAGDTRNCIAFAQGGLLLGTQAEVQSEIDRRADKNYSTQVYVTMDIGAVRMEECRVLQIQCKENV